jgi:hypothetical protein
MRDARPGGPCFVFVGLNAWMWTWKGARFSLHGPVPPPLFALQATMHAVLHRKKSHNPWVGVFLAKPDQVGPHPHPHPPTPHPPPPPTPRGAMHWPSVHARAAAFPPWLRMGACACDRSSIRVRCVQVDGPAESFSLTSVNQLYRIGCFAMIETVAPVEKGVQILVRGHRRIRITDVASLRPTMSVQVRCRAVLWPRRSLRRCRPTQPCSAPGGRRAAAAGFCGTAQPAESWQHPAMGCCTLLSRPPPRGWGCLLRVLHRLRPRAPPPPCFVQVRHIDAPPRESGKDPKEPTIKAYTNEILSTIREIVKINAMFREHVQYFVTTTDLQDSWKLVWEPGSV